MTGVVLVIPRRKFFLADGTPAALGWVTVYEAGTTTLATTWQDKAQTTENQNPQQLDANGEMLLWGDSSKTYKILLQDSSLATVSGWPVDNIPGAADVGAAATAAAAAAVAAVAATPGTYLGPVATRCYSPSTMLNDNATVTGFNSGSIHYATEDITSLKLVYGNYRVGTGTGDMTEKSSDMVDLVLAVGIEYPIGTTTTRVTFGGANTGTLLKGALLYSDFMSISIPAGAKFRVRTYWTKQGGGQCYIPTQYYAGGFPTGAYLGYDQTGVPGDLSLGTTTAASQFSPHIAGPQAILGMTSRRSFALIGDSRFVGSNDNAATSQYGDTGDVARALRAHGYLNLGTGFDSTTYWLASNALRLELAQHCTDIVLGFGTNDIAASASAATIIANLQSIMALFPTGKQFYWVTLYPISIASTDGYTTLANQSTSNGYNTTRQTLNALLRAGVPALSRVWDIAAVTESSLNSNKYRVNRGAITTDGIHLNATGSQLIADSGIISIPLIGSSDFA